MSTPATVFISESNGVGQVVTDNITNVNLGTVDSPNMVAADHPLVIPPVLTTVFSFQKWTRWKVSAWVDTTLINNFKWFKSAGSNAANWTETYAADVNPAYATPVRNNPPASFTPWPTTAGSAEPINGSFTNPATGYSSYAVFNVFITNATLAGAKGQHTITYRYDES